MLKTGHQSRKIGAFIAKGRRKGWPIYTLTLEERATCPRTCPHWLDCYGNNMQAAERITAGPELEAALEHELRALDEAHPDGFLVRVHVLGDFYSLAYVESLAADGGGPARASRFRLHRPRPCSEIGRSIAAASFDLGWDRFAFRFSGASGAHRAARVVEPGGNDAQAVMCPAQTGATDCCATCALCWQSERSIAFGRH